MTKPKAPQDPAKPPRKPRSVPAQSLLMEPGFRPTTPANGEDLMVDWDLPAEAWDSARVRIQRKKGMTQEMELIGETTIRDYSMQTIAKRFGPGEYYFYCSPNPQRLWGVHNCKISVAPEYAADAGYQKFGDRAPEMPRVTDVRAYQAMASSLEPGRNVTVGELASMVETIVEQTARRLQVPTPPVVPVQPMGMDQVMGFWSAMSQMQAETRRETLAMVKAAQGNHMDMPEKESDAWSDAIAKMLPALVQAFTPKVAELATQPQPALAGAPLPAGEPAVVNLTEAEQKQFGSIVVMLRPYVGMILELINKDPVPNILGIADNLVRWIPEPMEADLVAFADLVEKRGIAVMGFIAPQLVSTSAASILVEMAAILKQPREDEVKP